jgi:hypothetical protein
LSDPTKPSPPQRRTTVGRVRGYFLAWLLSSFAIVGLSLGDFTKKVVAGQEHGGAFAGHVLFGAIVALLALPILFLLRVVPEPSTSSVVRLVRRLLAGVLCGLLLGEVVAASIAASGRADATTEPMLAGAGALFGLIAGLVDSIALDDAGRARGDDAGEADSASPES